MTLRTAIEQRYPHSGGSVPAMRERLIAIAQEYLDNGRGDANAEQRLCSNNTHTYWQQLSEVLLGHQLTNAATPFSHQAVGPDFRIDNEGRRIWVEVITPTPVNVPAEWLAQPVVACATFPTKQFFFDGRPRLSKSQKFCSETRLSILDILPTELLVLRTVYGIAVNGRLLRGFAGAFDALVGNFTVSLCCRGNFRDWPPPNPHRS